MSQAPPAAVARRPGMLSLEELRVHAADSTIDTVVLAFTDMQGRLQGKRLSAEFFLAEVVENHAEGCNYLLAVDVEMNTVAGYAMSSWERGYGDFVLVPDLSTLRRLPWHAGTVLLLADLAWEDGSPVVASPRQILKAQTGRLAARGWTAFAGTELEFVVYAESYEQTSAQAYLELTPAKTGAKEIAAQQDMSVTFMAKPNQREGNSCHVHLSLRDAAGGPVLAGDGAHGLSPLGEHFLAGQLAGLREMSLFFAPNINSYKRYAAGSFAPTAARWGVDNRTCAYRLVGHGATLRPENRVPGGDVNPYLAVAAMIAGGLHGIERELPLEAAFTGNAYDDPGPRVPATLRDALEAWETSELSRATFGDDVVEHYANNARVELAAFDAAVTDWELRRSFERM